MRTERGWFVIFTVTWASWEYTDAVAPKMLQNINNIISFMVLIILRRRFFEHDSPTQCIFLYICKIIEVYTIYVLLQLESGDTANILRFIFYLLFYLIISSDFVVYNLCSFPGYNSCFNKFESDDLSSDMKIHLLLP